MTTAEESLGRPYAAIEKGTIDVDDLVLKGRVADLKLKRDEAAGLVRMLENDAAPDRSIDPIKVDRFVEAAAGILRDDQDARRRALIQLVVRKAFLDEGGLALSGDPADLAKAVAVCKKNQGYLVPSFVREWRAREDSNS